MYAALVVVQNCVLCQMEGYSLQGNIFLIKNTVLYETI